ncbi:MAG: hypothetical protein GX660_05760 [Clostridiaceae bacterium]|nr:hypothetical protein [Clostridiaceae bacterium]
MYKSRDFISRYTGGDMESTRLSRWFGCGVAAGFKLFITNEYGGKLC